MEVKAFSWRQAAKYISLNREYTGELEIIEKFLPVTNTGKARSMKNKEVNSKKEKDGYTQMKNQTKMKKENYYQE